MFGPLGKQTSLTPPAGVSALPAPGVPSAPAGRCDRRRPKQRWPRRNNKDSEGQKPGFRLFFRFLEGLFVFCCFFSFLGYGSVYFLFVCVCCFFGCLLGNFLDVFSWLFHRGFSWCRILVPFGRFLHLS